MSKYFIAIFIMAYAFVWHLAYAEPVQHNVYASAFITDANAPEIRASAFIYDPNAVPLHASAFIQD